MKEIKFGYGPMMETLEEQANKQGCTLGKKADMLEKIKYCINMCGFHVATETEIKSMTKRLNKLVIKNIKESIISD